MNVLKMKGQPISNLLKLRQYFDLCDMIQQREAFCSFAKGQLLLSAENKYLHAVLAALLSDGAAAVGCTGAVMPETLIQKLYSINGDNFWNNIPELSLNGQKFSAEERHFLPWQWNMPKEVFSWCGQYIPEERVRQELFLLITTACLLAGVELPQPMPSVKALLNAYYRNSADMVTIKELKLPADSSNAVERVELDCTAYYASPYTETPQRNDRIRTYWLVNTECRDSELRLNGKSYTIPGDIGLFVNAINGKIVAVLPNSVLPDGGGIAIERKCDCLEVHSNQQSKKIPIDPETPASSFAVSGDISSILYIENYVLKLEHYHGKDDLKAKYNGRRSVEAVIKDGNYYILFDNTRVCSNDRRWSDRLGVCHLAEV